MRSPHLQVTSSCAVGVHLCGEPCKLKDKKGCQGECTRV